VVADHNHTVVETHVDNKAIVVVVVVVVVGKMVVAVDNIVAVVVESLVVENLADEKAVVVVENLVDNKVVVVQAVSMLKLLELGVVHLLPLDTNSRLLKTIINYRINDNSFFFRFYL